MESVVYLRDFLAGCHDTGLAVRRALEACERVDARKLVLEPGELDIYPEYCFEEKLCMSNHDDNGPKRIALLIKNRKNFEIDCAGAVIRVHGIMTHFSILDSESITVRNAILENPRTEMLQTRVAAHGDGYVDLDILSGMEDFTVRNGELIVPFRNGALLPISTNIEFRPETGEIEPGTADQAIGGDWFGGDLRFEQLPGNRLRVRGITRYPRIGNIVVFNGSRRFGAGFFCENSGDLRLENVTVRSCFGMGIIAQMCHNITLDGFCTRQHGGQLYSSDADATHFVNCTGTVTVENGIFEGQLDDALNIHGIYTRIIGKEDHALYVREMHTEAQGIRIYREGDTVRALHPEPLLPYAEMQIAGVEYLNQEVVRLSFRESVDGITVGDDIENVSRSADLVFRNNVVRNNRARGMLIATPGKTVIENCTFHTSGTSIKFESDGNYWFESGGTEDVTIRGNVFDNCGYSLGWGGAVVECAGRNETEKDRYFHQHITVADNVFCGGFPTAVCFDNVREAIFTGNRSEAPLRVRLFHIGTAKVQEGTDVEADDVKERV